MFKLQLSRTALAAAKITFDGPSLFPDIAMSADPREERLVALELLVTHLERDLGALNAALLDQQKQIVSLKRVLNLLEKRVAQLPDQSGSRERGDERPPHD